MSAIFRIHDYFKFKGIKPTAFEKMVGISNGYFGTQKRNNGRIGEEVILLIVENCPDLNLHWLITGKGQMIENLSITTSISEKELDIIKSLKADAKNLLKRIEVIEKALSSI